MLAEASRQSAQAVARKEAPKIAEQLARPIRDPTKPFNDLYDREDFAECARVLIERRLKEGKTLPMIRAAAMWALYRGPSACVFTHPFHVRNNRLNNATVWVAQEMIIAASTARHQDGARNKEDILVMRNKEGGRNEDGAREKHGE